MTYWSLRALGNSAFPIAFSQEPLQPVIARKLNGIYAIAVGADSKLSHRAD